VPTFTTVLRLISVRQASNADSRRISKYSCVGLRGLQRSLPQCRATEAGAAAIGRVIGMPRMTRTRSIETPTRCTICAVSALNLSLFRDAGRQITPFAPTARYASWRNLRADAVKRALGLDFDETRSRYAMNVPFAQSTARHAGSYHHSRSLSSRHGATIFELQPQATTGIGVIG